MAEAHKRVVIAGGGVGALESVLALRDLLGMQVDITFACADREFVYQPLAVAEPFDASQARRWDLAGLAQDLGAALRPSNLAAVDPDARQARLEGGEALGYDALILAPGARKVAWLEGALTFRGRGDLAAIRELLARIEEGQVQDLAFAAPRGTGWLLPLYELALLTSSRIRDRRIPGVSLTLITAELEPLSVFGPAVSRGMRNLLANRGISIRTGEDATSWDGDMLHLSSRARIAADEVLTLPRLRGPALPGVPADSEGFIPTDEHGAVVGLMDVYAVGDAASFEIKQGGLAIQQADAAAEAIAAEFGAELEPRPFRPVLRGLLLTGLTPTFLRAELGRVEPQTSHPAWEAPWWPPSKIAGGHLARYLAGAREPQVEASPPEEEPSERPRLYPRRDEHGDLRDLALTLADMDAEAGEYSSALRWLEVVDHMVGARSEEVEERRARWAPHGRAHPVEPGSTAV